MGQHKTNPIAIAAKNGELPPKPTKMSKRERDRRMYAKCAEILYGPLIRAQAKLMEEDYTLEKPGDMTYVLGCQGTLNGEEKRFTVEIKAHSLVEAKRTVTDALTSKGFSDLTIRLNTGITAPKFFMESD